MTMRRLILALVALVVSTPAIAQQGTAFTYQGRLDDAGLPADGMYALSFSVWDAPAGGSQMGPVLNLASVPVTEGRFTVELDFGATPIEGTRWLQIGVRGVPLSPRQPLTAAPYAIHTRGLHVNDAGTFVGVGRQNVIGSERFGVFHPTTTGFGGMYVQTNGPSGQPFYGYSANGSPDMWTSFDGDTDKWHVNNNGNRLTVEGTGDVGIGTENPNAKLHVTGNGSGAILRATNGGPGGTAIIAGDVTGTGRAASFYGITSSPLFTCINDGSGDAAQFEGRVRVSGDYYGLGHMWLHAYEGDGNDGTAYVQARDESGVSSIDLVLRTQIFGNARDVMRFEGGSASIGAADPNSFKAKLYIPGTDTLIPIPTVRIDRQFLDGTLIEFRALGAARGNITVSGNTVSYNAFTGSHYTYPDACGPIARGTLVRMTGNNRATTDEPNAEVIYGVAPTTAANDPACLGAYLTSASEGAGDDVPDLVMAVGNGDMWVTDAGTGDLNPGDALIASAVPGCAMKDDPRRFEVGHVVARCAERVVWSDVAPDAEGVRRARVSVLFGAYERGPVESALAAENRALRDRLDAIERALESRGLLD